MNSSISQTPLASPQLTVALPVFNGGAVLQLAVASLLQQTFTDWELLIFDDGSTDDSVVRLAEISDPRIYIIRDGKNLGLATRLNQAIDLARGDFFARMDHDDICHPERFARQIDLLLSVPSLDLVGTYCITLSERNEILGALPKSGDHKAICARPWLGFYLPHPSWMGRIGWFRSHRYASPGPYCCEDQELLLRAHATSQYRILPQYLLAYRLRDQIKWRKNWRTRVTWYKVQCNYFLQFGRYKDVVLATLALFGRIAIDSLRVLKQQFVRARDDSSTGIREADVDVIQWRRLIQQLEAQEEAR